MTDRLPIALDLDAFLNLPIEEKPPLLGTTAKAAIVAGGLVLLGGKAGLGKTTLIVDAIYHMASGIDWLNFTVPRPLNVLIIENEGPIRMFQQKLQAKNTAWKHPLQGRIHVQTMAWGFFSFADHEHHSELAGYLDKHQIDVVVGDPIGTLGMQGVGSPEDTRSFVKLLIPLGLFDSRAFIFPVHFTKEPRKDEVDQISGAWGGHLDTLMILKAMRSKDELRLSFPKLRWWNDVNPKPLILGKVYNTHTFEVLREEGDVDALEDRIIDLLAGGRWLTVPEIANRNSGVEGGARQHDVKNALQARPDLFRWASGADHGRSAKAVVWALIRETGTSQTKETAQQSQIPLIPASGTSRDESDESPPDSLVPEGADESGRVGRVDPEALENHSSRENPPYRGFPGGVDEPDTASTHPGPWDESTANGDPPPEETALAAVAPDPDRIPLSALEPHPDDDLDL